jgi:putative ABC transport system permease protein
MTVAMRTTGNPTALLSAAREAVHSIDRNLPLSAVNTMDKLVESSVGQRKLSMMLLGLFSLIAVVLASIGIYGVMSYSVTQRSRRGFAWRSAPRGHACWRWSSARG